MDEGTPPLGLHSVRETCVGGWVSGDTLARETYSTPPTHSTPRGSKGKEFLLDFSLSVSCFLHPPPPPRLSSSHLVVVIHHGISKPFKASAQKMKASDPVYNWFPGGATVPIEPS